VPTLLLSVALPMEAVVVVILSPHLKGAISQTPHMDEISEAGGVEEAFPLPLMLHDRSAKFVTSPVMMPEIATIASTTCSSVTLQLTGLHRYIMHLSMPSRIRLVSGFKGHSSLDIQSCQSELQCRFLLRW
jgi:hypothetical protein